MRRCSNSANASVSEWVNDRPGFCAGPLPNNRDNVRTMHSSGTYRSWFGAVPRSSVQFLDDLARSVVESQFHEVAPASGGHEGSAAGDDHDDESGSGVEDEETSASDDRQTSEGNGYDGSKANDSGDNGRDTSNETDAGDIEDDEDASGRQSGALPTPMVAPSTSELQGTRDGPTVTREDVEGMLLDQRILFEMRLRPVKLEIMQHVTEEFARLRDFLSTLVPPSGGTSTFVAAPIMNEPNIWDDPTKV
ncbi:Hypothetical predicted protein [Olea europaea subsp. europaea]|uniref:Uncharacterized protein n=1 Tax=Olea europaea subsp. europaea TaxID=158383 RepID=A0A8S0UGV4_OLEEU|nr:Hypothetical predicted protein [Olea europaea subsp. europaea]